jgi:hypothetical protein
MAKGGRRFPLVIYRTMINRWWEVTFFLALVLLLLAWPVYQHPMSQAEPWRWQGLIILSGVALFFTALFLGLRSMAYVQPFPSYLRLVTPFLRINISYKRLRRYSTAEMRALFPPATTRGWKREVVAAMGGRTALVLELTGWPVNPKSMRLFLSPLFFKDKTPHFVILVDDWMRLSLELDSLRTRGTLTSQPQQRPQNQSILSRLPRKDS